MGIIERDHPKAKEWLEKEPFKCWARSHFNLTSKCDAVTNNFSELFNSWNLKLREMPLVQFVDKYTLNLSSLVYDRRMAGLNMDVAGLVPDALVMIAKLEKKYNRYKIQGVAGNTWCAINFKTCKKFTVDLQELTCSCMVWQMTGLPCVHAVAVIRPKREQWIRYCSPYFSVATFRATYDGFIFPIANEDDWGKVDIKEEVLPPPHLIQPARPRKMRIIDENEVPKRNGRQCSKCGQSGHNNRSCDRRKRAESGGKQANGKRKRNTGEFQEGTSNVGTTSRGGRATAARGGKTSLGRGRGGGMGKMNALVTPTRAHTTRASIESLTQSQSQPH